MCYFGLFGIVLLIEISFKLADLDKLSEAVDSYFFCELQGLPNECDRRSIEKYSHPEADIVPVIVLASIPMTQLLYIVNYKHIKECFINLLCKKKKLTETELTHY